MRFLGPWSGGEERSRVRLVRAIEAHSCSQGISREKPKDDEADWLQSSGVYGEFDVAG